MKKIVSFVLITALLITAFSGLAYGIEDTEMSKIRVIISFNEQPGDREKRLVQAFGGDIHFVYNIVPAIAATLPEAAINGLVNNPRIDKIEPDVEIHMDLTELENSWGVDRIDADLVHFSGNSGAGVKVAVIDTGIDYTHSDLAGNYVEGKDFVNGDDDPMDDAGHGTHVAGTIAAVKNDIGVVGVAPGAKLYALKVLDENGSGYFSAVIAALQWCIAKGIQVTNSSFGSALDPGTIVRDAYDDAYAAGIINIASAGNSGNKPGKGDNVGYPAKYSSVVAVAATDNSDHRAFFSSTGEDVEISAPGVSIKSTYLGGGYATLSGTSMASPHVAGTAALIIASASEPISPDDIRLIMQSTADDFGAVGLDTQYGYGLIDADEAAGVTETNTAPILSITSPTNGDSFESGASITFIGSALDAEDGNLSDSIVWTSNTETIIGTGASFSAVLSDGNHNITASVTDNDGNQGIDTIKVYIGQSTQVNKVDSIKYIDLSNKIFKKLAIEVSVVDKNGYPVVGEVVALNIEDNVIFEGATAVTDTTGIATFTFSKIDSGYYLITSISLSGTVIETPYDVLTNEGINL